MYLDNVEKSPKVSNFRIFMKGKKIRKTTKENAGITLIKKQCKIALFFYAYSIKKKMKLKPLFLQIKKQEQIVLYKKSQYNV